MKAFAREDYYITLEERCHRTITPYFNRIFFSTLQISFKCYLVKFICCRTNFFLVEFLEKLTNFYKFN